MNAQRNIKICKEAVILVYANDILVLKDIREEFAQTTVKLLKASLSMGLCVNWDNT